MWRGAVAAGMLLSALPLAAPPARAAGDGTVLAFGADMFGQLGDGGPDDGGGYVNQSSPVAVRGLGSASGVVAVASGDGHSLALRADGSVLQWGNDDHGTPSSGALNVPSSPSPFPVAGLGAGSGVVAVAAGGLQSLAVRADGSVLAWGPGQHTPADVAGLGPGSGAVAVSTGAFQNLVLRSDGSPPEAPVPASTEPRPSATPRSR